MPELAEVKIMSEYINQVSEGKKFVNVRKSDVSKVKTDLKGTWSLGFYIHSQSRGKELKIDICWKPECFKTHLGGDRTLLCNMGMSGNWSFTETDKTPKHAHLMFDTEDGWTLSLVDVRRFARWKWTEGWSNNRGPDPLEDWAAFVGKIIENIDSKQFKKPMYEVLMDQEYFNGIGNYLRAEILYRIDVNPFLPAKEYLIKAPSLFYHCHNVPREAYTIGGGQLKEWTNPFKEDKKTFAEWLKCYGKKGMSNIIDKKGRKFWYNHECVLSLSNG